MAENFAGFISFERPFGAGMLSCSDRLNPAFLLSLVHQEAGADFRFDAHVEFPDNVEFSDNYGSFSWIGTILRISRRSSASRRGIFDIWTKKTGKA
jgi:hypothetical protein